MEKTDLLARDGRIGRVHDFYFDDHTWGVRYLVADTGGWLSGRRVLIAPAAVAGIEPDGCRVQLTKQQVEESPSISADEPVSRQHETALHDYYGWPAYWGAGMFGAGAYPTPLGSGVLARAGVPRSNEPLTTASRQPAPEEPSGDPHLRSAQEVRGYAIAATDGSIGHVEDFCLDDNGWQIRYLVIDTVNWWPGRKVVIAPAWINRVSWNDQAVHVDLDRESIKGAPEYDAARGVSRDYADRLHDYYRRPRSDGW